MRKPKKIVIPNLVEICLRELHNLEEGEDQLKFNYEPSTLSAAIEAQVLDVEGIKNNLVRNFFEEQTDNFLSDQYPECIEFSEEEIEVVTIKVPEGIYYFLILGENGVMAIAYEDVEERLTYYYEPYEDEEAPIDIPPKYYWQQVMFPL